MAHSRWQLRSANFTERAYLFRLFFFRPRHTLNLRIPDELAGDNKCASFALPFVVVRFLGCSRFQSRRTGAYVNRHQWPSVLAGWVGLPLRVSKVHQGPFEPLTRFAPVTLQPGVDYPLRGDPLIDCAQSIAPERPLCIRCPKARSWPSPDFPPGHAPNDW
jgi:hypothetical protein